MRTFGLSVSIAIAAIPVCCSANFGLPVAAIRNLERIRLGQHGQHPPASPPTKTAPPQGHSGHGAAGQTGTQHGGHEQHGQKVHDAHAAMTGAFTSNAHQEGSGTAWLPAASPMDMVMGNLGGYRTHVMARINFQASDAGGKRGESDFYVNSMIMGSAQRAWGSGRLTWRLMGSLDPITNGKEGYPNLFQTGETAHGEPLKDRQHPHDLIMEAAGIWSAALAPGATGFLYLALVGEPAIGTAAFMHRPSGDEIPEAPINHHWNDGTHITYGVATLGVNLGDRWKIEGTAFNGREPDEDRYDLDPIRIDSYAGRITYNPNDRWSISASYAFLESPERLEPGVDQRRAVVGVFHSSPLPANRSLSLGLIASRNVKPDDDSDAWLVEGVYRTPSIDWYARFEWVEKDELVDVPEGVYEIGKLLFGGTKRLGVRNGWHWGLGGYVGLYDMPTELEPFYGRSPVTVGVYLSGRLASNR